MRNEEHFTFKKPDSEITVAASTELLVALEQVKDCCARLGSQARSLREAGLTVETKSDGSKVTNADLHLSKELEGLLPRVIDAPVISEENTALISTLQSRNLKEWWLIDPIDGTHSFIEGYPGYAICVALMRAGHPVLGVIAVPEEQVIYSAVAGSGAFKKDLTASLETPIHAMTRWHAPLRAGVFFHREPQHQSKLNHLLEKLGGGPDSAEPFAAALKYCSVADGTLDIAGGWTPIKIWDIAAADILVTEAGGRMIHADTHQPFDYSIDNLDVPCALAVGSSISVI